MEWHVLLFKPMCPLSEGLQRTLACMRVYIHMQLYVYMPLHVFLYLDALLHI